MGELPKKRVAAVIVTYNRATLLQECVNGVRGQSWSPDEIIVVNNGSTDGTAKWLEAQTDLMVLHQPNTGSAGGFSSGIRMAYQRGA